MKKRIVLLMACCAMVVFALTGCAANVQQQANDAQAQNRQYMNSVNTIMTDMNSGLDTFAESVKDGKVVSLSSELSTVNDAVDKLKAIEAPEAMKDVHDEYVKGAEELQTALTLYTKLYEDVKAPASGSFDYATYDARLQEVATHYNAGIDALKEADSKVSEA